MTGKLVIARLNHETNTFSPVPTPLAAFNPLFGAEAEVSADGSPTALGAFHAFAKNAGMQAVVPLIAHANPSGPVDDDAFEFMAEAILKAVKAGCDGILLDLHGAMVTKSHDDGEGELLARIRTIAPDTPLGVALDLHANVTPLMVANCDAIVGFKTYPHIDMVETGEHVARVMAPVLAGKPKPFVAWNHPPMLAATLCMNTTVDCAMSDLVRLASEAERRPGVQAVTVFGGFPIADIPEAGLSIVAVADTQELASEIAEEIASEAWQRRAEFVYHEEPLEKSIEKAIAASGSDKPVLLLDHGDNCNSGGTCDVMDGVEAILATGRIGLIVGPIADPQTVDQMFSAGEGANVDIALGNKTLPGGKPLKLSGKVRALSPGQYTVTGPIYHGQTLSMGRAAAFENDQAIIVVCEQPHEPLDLGVFTCLGIDALKADFLHLKSRMYCRPVFEPLASTVIDCTSKGVTSSNYDVFDFKRINRPVYPLDMNGDYALPRG